MGILAFLLLIVNFGISWWNAYATGKVWAESKAAGGWPRAMAWAGAVMSACGFTFVYAVVLALIAGATGYLPPQYVQGLLELTYVIIVLPILGSGMIIWVESLMTAWRERTFGNIAGAGWNTFAQIHNTYEAATMLPGIFKHLGELFAKGDDDDDLKDRLTMIVFALTLSIVHSCCYN